MTKQHLYLKWQARIDQTMVLNLDPDFSPFSSTENLFFLKFKKFNFLGGEPHFQITSDLPDNPGDLIITQRYNSVADLFDILLANDAARRMGFTNIKLILPYFPAARQDRVCNAGEPLTVKVFADLINGCDFNEVFIYGPHSEVTPALINNVTVIDNDAEYAMGIVFDNSDGHHFNIVCPDAGAGKRVGKIASYLANQDVIRVYHLVRCEKIRDVKDGSLKEFFVQDDDLGGYPTLILDDVVAKGGTFLGLAEKLRERNCGKLMIFTSHADCQEGLDNLASVFDAVYTTNSKRDYPETSKVNIIKFEI